MVRNLGRQYRISSSESKSLFSLVQVRPCRSLPSDLPCPALEEEGSPMMPVQDARASFRFSTDGLPEAARAKAVRELYEHTLLPGKLEPL